MGLVLLDKLPGLIVLEVLVSESAYRHYLFCGFPEIVGMICLLYCFGLILDLRYQLVIEIKPSY